MARILHNLVADAAQRHGSAAAVRIGEQGVTYDALLAAARRTAGALRGIGLGAGDRFAYFGKNDPRFFELLLAASLNGMVLVSLNWRLSAAELAAILDQSEARALFVGREFSALALDPEFVPGIRHRFQLDGEDASALIDYDGWRDRASAVAAAETRDDVVLLQLYTSGTTGLPKGVMHSHRNLLSLWDPALHPMPEWEFLAPGNQSLMAMPLFHVAGISASLSVLSSGNGGTLRIMRDFDPAAVIGLLEQEPVARLCVVPAIIRALLEALPPGPFRAPSLRHMLYGASPMPEALLNAAAEKFGCALIEVYGLTETSGYVTAMPDAERGRADELRRRSAGRALPGVELAVVDLAGRRLAAGETGEVLIRSSAVMTGYFRNAEATAEAIDAEGWLHTGDAGLITEDGYLVLKDRLKDLIISGGENVYPAEVENCLAACPGVADVAVVGIPDEKWGEVPLAFVVRRDEALDAQAVLAWAQARLAAYKLPRQVEFIAAIPRNASGKILHRELRAPYWGADKGAAQPRSAAAMSAVTVRDPR